MATKKTTKKTTKTKKAKTSTESTSFTVVESNVYKKDKKYDVSLRSPVVLMANKIKAFFNDFRDVSVQFDDENSVVYVYSTDHNKSDALNRFLVHEHTFGSLKLEVKVVDVANGTATVLDPPSWTITDKAMLEAFKMIFKRSPMTPDCTQAIDQVGTTWTFFEFPNYAITYQADSLLNIRGYDAILVADAVKEIFSLRPGYQVSTYAYYADEEEK